MKLEDFSVTEIRKIVSNYNKQVKIAGYSKLPKADLIKKLREHPALTITEGGEKIKIKVNKEIDAEKAPPKEKKAPAPKKEKPKPAPAKPKPAPAKKDNKITSPLSERKFNDTPYNRYFIDVDKGGYNYIKKRVDEAKSRKEINMLLNNYIYNTGVKDTAKGHQSIVERNYSRHKKGFDYLISEVNRRYPEAPAPEPPKAKPEVVMRKQAVKTKIKTNKNDEKILKNRNEADEKRVFVKVMLTTMKIKKANSREEISSLINDILSNPSIVITRQEHQNLIDAGIKREEELQAPAPAPKKAPAKPKPTPKPAPNSSEKIVVFGREFERRPVINNRVTLSGLNFKNKQEEKEYKRVLEGGKPKTKEKAPAELKKIYKDIEDDEKESKVSTVIKNWDSNINNIELEQNNKRLTDTIKGLINSKKKDINLDSIIAFDLPLTKELMDRYKFQKVLDGYKRFVEYLDDEGEKNIGKAKVKDYYFIRDGRIVSDAIMKKLPQLYQNKILEEWKK